MSTSKQVKAQPLPVSKAQSNECIFQTVEELIPLNSTRSTRYLEMEEYRKELEKQVEEKRRQKKFEEEKAKAEDEALENKLAQQRLNMYLEFMDERRRGEFIAKPKTNNIAASVPLTKPETSSPIKTALKPSASLENNISTLSPPTQSTTNIPTCKNITLINFTLTFEYSRSRF